MIAKILWKYDCNNFNNTYNCHVLVVEAHENEESKQNSL